jgi:L-alanine-DL-glutamate epimerase-like enolase superfamily enzyme
MTRIAEILTHPLSVELTEPLYTAHERHTHAHLIVVEVRTDDGLRGTAEIHATPMPAICDWVAKFAELLRGQDALATTDRWEGLFALTSPRPGGMFARDGLPRPIARSARAQVMAAIGGIDLALWDIRGKAAGVPVWRLLGGSGEPVRSYATGGFYREGAPLDAGAKELAGFVAAGYRAVKLKTGGLGIVQEVERIRLTREAIGPDVLLMLDMNAAFSLPDCIRFAHAVEPHDVFWLEEPLHWQLSPTDFAQLARATHIPIGHGERELTRHTVRDFIVDGGIRYVQFDATRAGGMTEAVRIAHLAEQYSVSIAPHLAPEIHSHLVAAFRNASFGVETMGAADRNPLSYGLYTQRMAMREGMVEIPQGAGFGAEVDWSFVAKHRA